MCRCSALSPRRQRDDRREAQSEALVYAAEKHGFKVLEMPVERTQEAQIEAVRALIVYQVDAIRIYAAGGKRLGQRAARSKIRLRATAVDRPVRYAAWMMPLQHIGFDYASLAEQAADALLQQRMPRDGVLELYGTVNASDAREIARGCRASLEEHGLTVTYSLCGDGMRSRGCEILEEMEDHLDEIGYIFAQNDANGARCGGLSAQPRPQTGQGCADLCVWRRCGAARAAEKGRLP